MAIRWQLGGVYVAIIPSDPSMCGSSGLSCTLWMGGDCSSKSQIACAPRLLRIKNFHVEGKLSSIKKHIVT